MPIPSTRSIFSAQSTPAISFPEDHQRVLTDTAEQMAQERGTEYAKASAPRSPNPALSGNTVPMQTRLNWLAGRWKCNQFVGDALFTAGFQMPLVKMPDGSAHYLNAEKLPSRKDFFEIVTRRENIRAGDVLVLDYTNGSGENGAHTEIIQSIEPYTGTLRTIGAHANGATVGERRGLLQSPFAPGAFWSTHSAHVYILRPKKLLH